MITPEEVEEQALETEERLWAARRRDDEADEEHAALVAWSEEQDRLADLEAVEAEAWDLEW